MRTTSRSSKTIIGLLAVIVVLLWRGTRRQRRLLRLVSTFGLRYPGEGAVNAVTGWFGNVGGDIKNFVTSAIRVVADALQSGIDWVLSVAQHAGAFAWDLYNLAKDFAWGIVSELRGYVVSLYWQAVDFAQRAAGAARDFALSFARWVYESASNLAHSLYDAAIWTAHFLYDQGNALMRAAFDAAMRTAHFLYDQGNALMRAAFDTAVRTAHFLFDQGNALMRMALDAANTAIMHTVHEVETRLGDQVSTVNDYLFGSVQAIIDAVITVVDWVVALAEFPFTTARDLWASMRNTGGATVRDHMPGMVDRWADHIGDHVRNNASARDKGYQLAPLPGHDYGGGGGGGGGGGTQGSGTPDRGAFAVGVLTALGAPATESNLRFMAAWMAHENTRATFNPLATTLAYGQGWTNFNDVGVKNYPDLWTGTGATAQTIIGSDYPTILAALRAGDGHAAGQAHRDLSRWSGGGYDTIAA